MTQDAADFWIDPDLGGLECLRATYVQHRFAPHAHEEYVIGVIESGAQRVRLKGGHEIMPERSLCVFNPGEQHTGHAATSVGWTYSVIYPSPAILQEVASQVRDGRPCEPHCLRLVNFDPQLQDEFLHLHRALRSGMAGLLAKQALLLGFLARMVQRHCRVQPSQLLDSVDRSGVRRAQDYLHAHACEPVPLEQLARHAGTSPYHFARSFKKVFGVPPHVYQLRARIAEAKRLLATGEPIVQVAAATGFVDQSHLSNRFKAVMGVTPGQYLKQSKNLQDAARTRG